MIKHNITQGTADWLELRHGKITGTASKGLFIKSDTLLIYLISKPIVSSSESPSGLMQRIGIDAFCKNPTSLNEINNSSEIASLAYGSSSVPLTISAEE